MCIESLDAEIEEHQNRGRGSASKISNQGLHRANVYAGAHTYAHTRDICTNAVQDGHHVASLRDRALQTGIEGIPGKERDELGLTGILRI